MLSAAHGQSIATESVNEKRALEGARRLMSSAHQADAIPILSEVIGRQPSCTEAYGIRGQAYFCMEEFTRAARDFRHYFSSNTAKNADDRLHHRSFGLCLCQLQDFPGALVQFNICIAMAPKNIDSWWDRARFYIDMGQLDKALSDANVGVSLNPDQHRLNLRARIELKLKMYDKAAKDWTDAIKLSPSPAFYASRSQCYAKMGRPDLAAKDDATRDRLAREAF